MSSKVDVFVHLRRFDISESPDIISKQICLDKSLDYVALSKEVNSICGLDNTDGKVVKLRNADYALLPLSSLLDGSTQDSPFIIDVAKIQHVTSKPNASLLQDAYLDAIRQKLHNMESRVSQAEQLIPQLQWRRQAHMEQVINAMSSRVAFLNRRIDELMPSEWKAKLPQSNL